MRRSEQPILYIGPLVPEQWSMDPEVMCRWLRYLTDQLFPVTEEED